MSSADWDTQADLVGAATAIDLLDGASCTAGRCARIGDGTLGMVRCLCGAAAAALLKGRFPR